MTNKRKALFLDRDGVINVDVNYAHLPEQITFVRGIDLVIRRAKEQDFLIIVVTNQAGIARGIYTEEQLHALMKWMNEELGKVYAGWDAYYFCPHHPEFTGDCECRKPKPGMLLKARDEWNIDMSESIMIGDKESDMEAAKAAGIDKLILRESNKSFSD